MLFRRTKKRMLDAGTRPVVGIPRALAYYLHPGLWETFFRELGCDVALSAPSSRVTVEAAGLISESEHCLPVKLFDAHFAELAGRVDRVLVPRILSMLPGHIACPKLGALPDCARAQCADPEKILTLEIDEKRTPLAQSLERLGRSLTSDSARLSRAVERALAAWREARSQPPPRVEQGRLHVLIVGHPYNLYDGFISAPVLDTLEHLGVVAERICFDAPEPPPDPLKWDVCSSIYDTFRRASPGAWDGVVHLSSFNCGCDSVAGVFYHDLLREKRIPCMTLVMDGLTGLAGLETRLEAFVDSLKSREGVRG